MVERSYPYKAWVAVTSGRVQQVELTRNYGYGQTDYDALITGKIYHVKDLHPTRAAALQWLQEDLKRQAAALVKKQDNLLKKQAILAAELLKAVPV